MITPIRHWRFPVGNNEAKYKWHLLQPGESLKTLRIKYGQPVSKIKEWNNIKDVITDVYSGMRLIVDNSGTGDIYERQRLEMQKKAEAKERELKEVRTRLKKRVKTGYARTLTRSFNKQCLPHQYLTQQPKVLRNLQVNRLKIKMVATKTVAQMIVGLNPTVTVHRRMKIAMPPMSMVNLPLVKMRISENKEDIIGCNLIVSNMIFLNRFSTV